MHFGDIGSGVMRLRLPIPKHAIFRLVACRAGTYGHFIGNKRG